jgi:hypothetical protein
MQSSAEPALENAAPVYSGRAETRPQTKFERRGLVRDLLFRRI